MDLPDGSILMHGSTPYDPKKAHEYYLRTRMLKGRQRGGQPQQPTHSVSKRAAGFTVKGRDGKTVTVSEKELNEAKAYAAKRVADIKGRLNELNQELKKKLAVAKAADAKEKRGPTVADKRKSAKESKQYRDKHKQQLKNKRKHDAKKSSSSHKKSGHSVKSLEAQIAKVHGALRVAVERQRALTSATKNG
jgi:hypothetical protein